MNPDVAVVILAGGEGRRIGGGKPLRTLCGTRLIDWAVQQARLWSEVIAIALRDPSQVDGCEIDIIRDREDGEGPLGGLASALDFARGRECQLVLTIPADMPFLPSNLLERLGGALSGHSSALASSGGHVHPVCGLWSARAADQITSYVETGRRSLRGFAELIGCATVEWPTAPLDPFFNINSPDDLAEAERLLGS